jgi:cytochrome c551
MKKMAVSLLLFAVFLAVSACGGNNNNNNNGAPAGTNSPAASPTGSPSGTAAAADAEALYRANCVACHAADLSGGMGSRLKDVGARLTQEQIADVIANGGNSMRAFKGTLSDDEIHALAAWLAAMKG